LMKIAKHPVIGKSKKTWNLLPPCWWTLWILSKAPLHLLRTWMADGRVHAEMTANDATTLFPAWVLPRRRAKELEPIRDPDGVRLRIPLVEMHMDGRSAERSQVLTTLRRVGFNMGDLEDEVADIDAGAEGTQTPMPAADITLISRMTIDKAIDDLEMDKFRGDLIRSPRFEKWVLGAMFRLRRLLDAL
jgi:hypothetical protein